MNLLTVFEGVRRSFQIPNTEGEREALGSKIFEFADAF